MAGAPFRFLRLGNMLLRRDRPRAAVIEYEKGAKAVGAQGSGDGAAASWLFPVKLGRTYLVLGEPERALKALAPVQASFPDLPWPHVIAGEALLAKGAPGEAIVDLRAALATNPFDPEVHCALADAYEKEIETVVVRAVGSGSRSRALLPGPGPDRGGASPGGTSGRLEAPPTAAAAPESEWAAVVLSGLTFPTGQFVYDQYMWHIEGLFGFTSRVPGGGGGTTRFNEFIFGAGGWFHLSHGTNSDFSLGGVIAVDTTSGPGPPRRSHRSSRVRKSGPSKPLTSPSRPEAAWPSCSATRARARTSLCRAADRLLRFHLLFPVVDLTGPAEPSWARQDTHGAEANRREHTQCISVGRMSGAPGRLCGRETAGRKR